jgi:NAD(P)-dependent dehydrogenase (short-subunit alcohol dehydrogenase family)
MKTILITGANRGIGLELSRQYYQDGWHVIACMRDLAHAAALDDFSSQSATGKITPLALDVNNPASMEKLARALADVPIDILINNAGVFGDSHIPSAQIQLDACLDVFRTNTLAPLLLVQKLLPQIAKSRLKIIANMSSEMGSIKNNTAGGSYIYRASKAALNMITKSLSIDLKPQGITVISLDPGWVQTDMGGAKAPLTTIESVTGLKNILSALSLKDTGCFINYDGKKLPW